MFQQQISWFSHRRGTWQRRKVRQQALFYGADAVDEVRAAREICYALVNIITRSEQELLYEK